jgi:hypothetical protein
MKYYKSDLNKVIDYYGLDYREGNGNCQLRTYCHHHNGDGNYKLYAYFDDDESVHLYCYSSCGSMDLVGFIMHYKDCDYRTAQNEIDMIVGRRHRVGFVAQELYNPAKQLEKRHENKSSADIKRLSAEILSSYSNYAYEGWVNEGISAETQAKFGIRFSIPDNKVIIPQVDKDGELIGVRGRSLDDYEVEMYGKYRPVTFRGKTLSFPTSLNWYGLYQNKETIMKTKQVIIFESEKSVMQLDTMMNGHGNGLALSGSSISDWQIRELMKLDINEVVVGLDKDYKDDVGYNLHANLIVKMFSKLLLRFNVTVIFDDVDGLLGYKDSPTDCGKETFLKLMKTRKVMSL